MSRFFAQQVSDSGSSYASSSGSEDEIDEQQTPVEVVAPVASKRDKFLKGNSADSSSDSDDDFLSDSSSDDDDDAPRRVRSARDKRFDDMRSNISLLNNAKKIADWVVVLNEFEKLVKTVASVKPPRFFIRALVRLDDGVSAAATKEGKKKLNALNAKSLMALKQKLKKYCTGDILALMQAFRDDPVEEEDSFSEAEEAPDPKAKKVHFPQKEEAAKQADDDSEFIVVGKGGKATNLLVSAETLFKKLKEIIDMRGKKGTDKALVIQQLRKLVGISKTAYQESRVLLALIPAQFDSPSTSLGLAKDISRILQLIQENPNLLIKEGVDSPEDDVAQDLLAQDGENVEILGNLGSFVDRLDEEFRKSLQNIDPHTKEYIDRLKDESLLYGLIVRSQAHYITTKCQDDLVYSLVLLRRVEHIYFKTHAVIKLVEDSVAKENPKFAHLLSDADPLQSLCTELYKTKDERIRTRAVLCHVYYHALHSRFYEARDMLLMSHLQETINQADIETQILYNRALVQVGICAFKCGLVRESANALQEISASGRVKELLAQGFTHVRPGPSGTAGTNSLWEKTVEQETMEKQRLMPFHMHINLELLECIYLTCSLLQEIPNMALNSLDSRRRVISKTFRRFLDYSERQYFSGPPENTRDHIMCAAKSLSIGDWKSARDLISVIKIWDLLPDTDSIKAMLEDKIKQESLRTYIFSYSRYCESLSISSLATMFDLPVKPTVRSIVSKMIVKRELPGATICTETDDLILFSKEAGHALRMESLANSYVDKIAGLVEANERLLETKIGGGKSSRVAVGTGRKIGR